MLSMKSQKNDMHLKIIDVMSNEQRKLHPVNFTEFESRKNAFKSEINLPESHREIDNIKLNLKLKTLLI